MSIRSYTVGIVVVLFTLVEIAVAGDAALPREVISLPPSDVVSADRPYVLSVHVPDTAPRERISIVCTLRHPEAGDINIEGHFDAPAEGPLRVSLEARPLAPGMYRGEVTVVAGDFLARREVSFYRMPETLDRPFPYGIYVVPFSRKAPEIDAQLKVIEEAGFNFISNHTFGLDDYGHRLVWDRTARTTIRMRPSMRYWRRGQRGVVPIGEHQVLADGTAIKKKWCFRRESFRTSAAGVIEERLRDYRKHPAFDHAAFFGDDLFISAKVSNGRVSMGGYCDFCKDAFKKSTGLDAPIAPQARRAVMASSSPWLLWMKDRSFGNYGGFVACIEAAKNRVDPGIEIGLAHGAPDNPFVGVETGLYGPLTQRMRVVSSYCYPFLRSPAADFIAHYEIAKMGNRDKDVWQLGILAADRTPVPAGHVKQNYWNMLAAGYRAISFFSWYDINGIWGILFTKLPPTCSVQGYAEVPQES